MKFRQIYKDDLTLMYKVEYKDNIKNIRAKVDKKNEVLVTSPPFVTLEQLDQFVLNHFDKFYKFIEGYKQNTLIDLNNNFVYIFNKKYEIKIQLTKGRQKYEIIDNKVYLFLKDEENKKLIIKKLFHDKANTYLINRCKSLAKQLKFTVEGGIETKWYETKWGQCNVESRRITLADQLIMFNDEIVDYVIIHELCHLVHADHSPNFWKLVENYYPKFKWAREKLKFQC
ncbi:MAG: M48 family metallopeptidase [Mycoplasma sp.]